MSNHETEKRMMKKTLCAKYRNEVEAVNIRERPLHLYSFRAYLAYNNLWYYINRNLITKDEYDVMMQLRCYKYPRRYMGMK